MTAKIWNEISDCPNSGKFLIYILENDKVMKSEFRPIANSGMTTKTLDFLKNRGLVEIEEIFKPYHTYWITLTDKGYNVALKYKAISDIENGLTPEPENNYSASGEVPQITKKT